MCHFADDLIEWSFRDDCIIDRIQHGERVCSIRGFDGFAETINIVLY